MNKGQNSLFLKVLRGEPAERTPVWIMRQAGRYLPEYQEIRKKYSFSTMYKTPEIAVEISLQPVTRLGVDAAIIFSDIMVIPEAMGMKVEFIDGKGPVFDKPISSEYDIKNLGEYDRNELDYVFDAVKMLRSELNETLPVIGFCGAPFTLAKYMIDGSNTKANRGIKELRFGRPELLHILLEKITNACISYCKEKISAGAQVIQLFDSSAGILDSEGYYEFAYSYSRKIFEELRDEPAFTIYFSRNTSQWLPKIKDIRADVISLDWSVSPQEAIRILGSEIALQGNLDPSALYSSTSDVRRLVREMLKGFSGAKKYIANLGHGLMPDMAVENVQEFVNSVKTESKNILS